MKPLFATDAPTSLVGFVDITKQQKPTDFEPQIAVLMTSLINVDANL